MNRPFLAFTFLAVFSALSHGQAKTTASRAGDLQVGGGFTTASSDYAANRIKGFGFYGDFDFRENIGVEVDFHQLDDPNSAVYERTYEVGGRYLRHYGRFTPYAKGLYGRGVFNFPYNEANLAYNMMVAGAGVDIAVHPKVNVRADFEYQDWLSGPGLHDGLSPTLITIGVAYHFGAGRLSTR